MPSVAKKQIDYCRIARKYCEDIVSGRIAACQFVKQACQRQMNDLLKQEDDDFAWRFDKRKAAKVCRFVDLCPHVEGRKFAGKPFNLQPWQIFLLTSIFGWVNKETDARRFKRAYSEIPRGNGKSAMLAAVADYMAFADGEPGAQVYSAATSVPQAKVVFRASQAMLRKMPLFCQRAGITVEAHSISQIGTNSFYRPLSSEAKGVEGILPSFISVDELHAHSTRELYDNLETASGKREGSLLWAISTAGNDRAGICYDVRSYLVKVLNGSLVDDSFFGCIWTIDEGDEWAEPSVWQKANPNWGVCVIPEEIAAKAHKAIQLASAQPAFKTKHLNVWVGAHGCWMDMLRFGKCAGKDLSEEDFAGQPCIIGLDLASKLDLLAKAKVFWKEIEGKLHYYAFGTYWTPESRIEGASNSQYQGWHIDGWLRASPGETNDYGLAEDDIREDAKKFEVLEVCHDPWQAHETMTRLASEGLTVVEVPQLPKHLSDPMKELEAAVYDGRFHFNGDPILSWAMSNVVAWADKNDNLFPNKEKAENKIDPVTALLTALNGVARHTQGTPSGSIDVIGGCEKCGDLCIGVVVGENVKFRCPKHKE